MTGTTISHYELLGKIGSGGMGEVYLAQDTELNRRVALKIISRIHGAAPKTRTRFKREARATAALNHPNVVTIHHVGEHHGILFIVMEYVDGETLRDWMAKNEHSIEDVITVAAQICRGLSTAHAAGIIHRDLKPENILLDKEGRIRILDFGLAKQREAKKLTGENNLLGTLSYTSPEQIQGLDLDERADIWAVGVLLYEMLTGHMPFQSKYEAELVYAIAHHPATPVSRMRRGIPPALENIISKALSKDREQRYASTIDLLVALGTVGQPPRVTTQTRNSQPFNRWLLLWGAVLMFVPVVFLIYPRIFLEKQTEASAKIMLAVMPFEDLGPIERTYFSDGITEEITTRLSGFQQFGVVSRKTMTLYKQSKKSTAEIGRELNVGYVLEGTVRWQASDTSSSRIRVTPKLVRVADDTYLWAKTYDKVLDDMLLVQTDIAQDVMEALNHRLLHNQVKILSRNANSP